MRDVTSVPSPQRRRRQLLWSAAIFGAGGLLSAVVFVLALTMGNVGMYVGFGLMTVFQLAQFIWAVQQLRLGGR